MVMRIAGWFELRDAFLHDALNIGQREQAAQPVVIVHHEQLVDAGVFREELVRGGNRVAAKLLLVDGLDLAARRQHLDGFAFCVTRLDDMPGEQADEFPIGVHHREGAKPEPFRLDQLQHVADQLVWSNLDRLLDEAVHRVLHAADLGDLLALRHIVMDEAEAAVERHADGHARLGDSVHVRRDDGDVEVQSFGKTRLQHGVAREDFGELRGQSHVVEREAELGVSREKFVRRLEKLPVEVIRLFSCHGQM